MSGKRRDAFGLLLATLLALGLILWGACFWIAPVWQWGYRPAAYEAPAAPRQESEETVRWPIDLNRADAQPPSTARSARWKNWMRCAGSRPGWWKAGTVWSKWAPPAESATKQGGSDFGTRQHLYQSGIELAGL